MRTVSRSRFSALLPVATTVLAAIGACARAPVPSAPRAPFAERIVVASTGANASFSALAERLAVADVVFLGEQHDDSATHRLELRVLEALGAAGRPVVLSLEMFERDAQPVLDAYLAGRIPEQEMLARSRPWPRYASDYRPMVELAKARGWPVIASNVPRSTASAVGRRGLAALDSLPAEARAFAARQVECPDDAYRARFLAEMRSHSPGGAAAQRGDTLPTAAAERFYLAQCVKDETMAESILDAVRAVPNAVVLHVTGAFHSDFGQGTVERVRRRDPSLRVVVLTAVPTAEPGRADARPHARRADYVIFVARPAGR